MNHDVVELLQAEQRAARPDFSPALHDRLTAAVARDRRRRQRIRTLAVLAACLALAVTLALRNAEPEPTGPPRVAQAEMTSPAPLRGVGVLLQRSDRTIVELTRRSGSSLESLGSPWRRLDASVLSRPLTNRLPLSLPLTVTESPSLEGRSGAAAPRG